MEKLIFFNKKGQSLIEAVVAISIVVIAVVGIMSVGLTTVSLGGQSKERVMAITLAREGIEIVSATRNSNLLDPSQIWPYGLTNNSYRVGFDPAGLVAPPSLGSVAAPGGVSIPENCTNCQLCQHPDNEYYYHNDDCVTWSPFHRLVVISAGDDLGGNCGSPADCEKKVISSVYWEERGKVHTISIEARFTDWR